MAKQRLDMALVARGLAESRSKAQAYIMAGLVFHGERKLDKAGLEVPDDMDITVRGKEHPWVSRGGMKLAKGLQHFALDVQGVVAMDVGASTGGFTDVLLTNGAAKVYAVDVGHGQLDVKLRHDPRVVVMEETNARHLTAEMLAAACSPSRVREGLGEGARATHTTTELSGALPPPSLPPQAGGGEDEAPQAVGNGEAPQAGGGVLDLIVCDASFISLKKVLPAALALGKPTARLLTLIKPQFEVGKAEVSRGKGVIRDAALHAAVCSDIRQWLEEGGWQVHGITESPITGPKGNKEFLLYASRATS